MKRTGFDLPLLIGGATTSAKHTAVKIAPTYQYGSDPRARCVAVGGRRREADQPRSPAAVRRGESRAAEAARGVVREAAGGQARAVC